MTTTTPPARYDPALLGELLDRAREVCATYSFDPDEVCAVVRECAHAFPSYTLRESFDFAVVLLGNARANGNRFVVFNVADAPHALTCLDCRRTTHNTNDVRFLFCPVHKWLTPPMGDDAAPRADRDEGRGALRVVDERAPFDVSDFRRALERPCPRARLDLQRQRMPDDDDDADDLPPAA